VQIRSQSSLNLQTTFVHGRETGRLNVGAAPRVTDDVDDATDEDGD
jgi:hypothetical protein